MKWPIDSNRLSFSFISHSWFSCYDLGVAKRLQDSLSLKTAATAGLGSGSLAALSLAFEVPCDTVFDLILVQARKASGIKSPLVSNAPFREGLHTFIDRFLLHKKPAQITDRCFIYLPRGPYPNRLHSSYSSISEVREVLLGANSHLDLNHSEGSRGACLNSLRLSRLTVLTSPFEWDALADIKPSLKWVLDLENPGVSGLVDLYMRGQQDCDHFLKSIDSIFLNPFRKESQSKV